MIVATFYYSDSATLITLRRHSLDLISNLFLGVTPSPQDEHEEEHHGDQSYDRAQRRRGDHPSVGSWRTDHTPSHIRCQQPPWLAVRGGFLRTGDDLQVNGAAVRAGGVAGPADVLP